MIPKIAFTHWKGDMSWIRQRGLDSFCEHNPDWELRLLCNPPDIKNLPPAPAGDWTVWRELLEHGGFRIDSDMIHMKPIPDEWLEYDMCAQFTSTGNVYQMAVVGVRSGHSLIRASVDYCVAHATQVAGRVKSTLSPDDPSYQAFGVNMLSKLHKNGLTDYGNSFRLSDELFCPYHWEYGPRQMWSEIGPDEALPETSIGVHWYGGHPISRNMEHAACEGGPSWIERLASGS